jgi:hypothetical protein
MSLGLAGSGTRRCELEGIEDEQRPEQQGNFARFEWPEYIPGPFSNELIRTVTGIEIAAENRLGYKCHSHYAKDA